MVGEERDRIRGGIHTMEKKMGNIKSREKIKLDGISESFKRFARSYRTCVNRWVKILVKKKRSVSEENL